ncbi:MAG: hypothetical protein MUC49_02630 [Raineya sp.]|jgi:hypothetical protein|nr:hypothetical protein [Raineya sp.]
MTFTTESLYTFFLQKIEAFTNSKYWILKSTILFFSICIITSFPDYHWYKENKNSLIFEALDWQIQHPFEKLPSKYTTFSKGEMTGTASHLDKRWSRVTIPLIAYSLGFGTFGGIVLQHITGVLFFSVLLSLIYRLTKDKQISFLFGAIFAFIFIGKWSFYDFVYYDGIAYILMLLAMWRKNFIIVFFSVLLASFVDERALVASSMIFVWWYLQNNSIHDFSIRSIFKLNSSAIAVVLAWFAHLVIRYFVLMKYFHLSPGTSGIGLEVVRYNFKYIPMGLFTYLEFAWILIVLMFLHLYHQKRFFLVLLLLASLGLSQIISFLVYDVTRSIAYSFPILFIALYILHHYLEGQKLKKYLLIIAIGCFLLPTHAVFVDGVQWLSPIVPKVFKLL